MQRLIPLQTVLTLTLPDDKDARGYVSTVLGYGRYGLQLSMPQILNQTYSLATMTNLVCFYVSVSSQQLLSFKTYVMGYERTEPPCMVVAVPTTLEEANRRSTLRLKTELPVGYISEGEEVWGEQTRTIDISLGGLRMMTGRILPPGTLLSLTLEIPDETLLLYGRVAWSSFQGRRAMAGVMFLKMRETAQAALSKFVVGLERHSRSPNGQ